MHTLIYVHIPKTAGTTFRIILESYAGKGRLFSAYPGAGPEHNTIHDWQNLTSEEKSNIRVVTGHYHFDAFDQFIDSPNKKFVTFLRFPVDRVISFYKHVLATDPRYREQPVSLLKFLTESPSDIQLQIDNHQTRIIAGVPSETKVNGDYLERAKRILLEKFSFVGTTESFSEDLSNLSKKIGENLPIQSPKNVSSDRTGKEYYSKIELDLIAERNKFDSELYRYIADNRADLQNWKAL